MKSIHKASNGAGFNILNKEGQKQQKATDGVVIETCDTRLKLSENDNLLDALLSTGHELDYQCRGGYCGSCRVKVSSGSVEYDDFPLAHVGVDEILPCCCRIIEPLKIDVALRKISNT